MCRFLNILQVSKGMDREKEGIKRKGNSGKAVSLELTLCWTHSK